MWMNTYKRYFSPKVRQFLDILSANLLVWALLGLYMLPVASMIVTAMKSSEQLTDKNAPPYPARIKEYDYEGQTYQLYHVPTEDGLRQWALVNPGRDSSQFIDPKHPEAGLIPWPGNWRSLTGIYKFHPTWRNFTRLFQTLPFPKMLGNTLLMTLVGEIGILTSSIIVAYGFARFPLPGGNLLFYILIATILIPDKVTFIPSFFFYVNILHWKGTLYPILLPLFFGNAVYIFLLRQNFRSIPIDLEEAAVLDGAGPLRRLFAIVLPQSWPVVTTVSLLHFFYTWNETRLASLYLTTNSTFMPLSFGVQNYQSRIPIENVIQASTLVILVVPGIVLLLAQRFFMQGLVITGMEK